MFEIAHQGYVVAEGGCYVAACVPHFYDLSFVYVAAGVNIPLFHECVVVQIRVFFLDF
jgi:hypothetical protein